MDHYKCEHCEDGILTVEKACTFKWRVKCSKCNFNELYTGSLLMKYIYYIINKEKINGR